MPGTHLIKIVKRKSYLEEFLQEGKLGVNCLKFYRTSSNGSIDDDFDPEEGFWSYVMSPEKVSTVFNKDSYVCKREVNNGVNIIDVSAVSNLFVEDVACLDSVVADDMYISCWGILAAKDEDELIKKSEKWLKRNVKSGLSYFVVCDYSKLVDAFERTGILTCCGEVYYTDGSLEDRLKLQNGFLDAKDILLVKNKRFEGQEEYRFVLKRGLSKDFGLFKLSLTDFGVVLSGRITVNLEVF